MDDYTSKYKGEQVEVALFGGDYQEGVLTAYCSIDDIAHVELNGHILIPLQNVASLHCSSRCDAPEPDWPPRGLSVVRRKLPPEGVEFMRRCLQVDVRRRYRDAVEMRTAFERVRPAILAWNRHARGRK